MQIINGPKVISSSSDKAKLFFMTFASNFMLDDKGHPFLDFPQFTEYKLSNIFITGQEGWWLIKSLDTKNITGPDEIPVGVLKNINSYLQS